MTVILVLLFILTAVAVDEVKKRRAKIASAVKSILPSDVMLNNVSVGLTMADGGKKVENKEKK